MTTMWRIVLTIAVSLVAASGGFAQDWEETQKLLASDGASGDRFGYAVAADAGTCVIGATADDVQAGSAYVFVNNSGVWTAQAHLVATDGTGGGRRLGSAIAISGDTVVLGAFGDNVNDSASGSAYVFVRNNGVWSEQAKLVPDDGARLDQFGISVAIDGDTIVVGAHQDDDRGDRSGSAYVFERQSGAWTQRQKLLASDGLSLSYFGKSVALRGETLLVGSYKADFAGAVYVFSSDNGVWSESAKLIPDDRQGNDQFGWSVALGEDFAAIGAIDTDDLGFGSGSVYVFDQAGGGWAQHSKLLATDGGINEQLGYCVAVDGDQIVSGAWLKDDPEQDSGAAYIFARVGSSWVQADKIFPSDPIPFGYFGASAAITDGTVFAGAYQDDDLGNLSGGAYVFSSDANGCVADWNTDGTVDTRDFIAYLNAWTSGDTGADLNDDEVVDTRDFIVFLNLWVAGC